VGWLVTQRARSVLAREGAEVLRLETDGGFRIPFSKRNEFLRKRSCTSPTGKLQFALASLGLNPVVDPARFVVLQAAAGARDISAKLSRSILRVEEPGLRRRIDEGIAAYPAAPARDAAAMAKISSALRPIYARAVPETLVARLERNRKIQDGVAERHAGLRKAGESAQEVERARLRETGYLNK
jgi:hypothetical protein